MKSKKKIFFILLIVPLILFTSSCHISDEEILSKDERAWIDKQDGKIEVLFGYEAPPNAYHDDNGEYTGLLVDFLHEIERYAGIKFRFRNFKTWNDLIEYSKKGRNFIVVGIAETKARSEFLSFTDSFIKVPYIIVTRKTSKINSMLDLKNNKICTVKNYAVNDYLAKYYKDLNITHSDDNLEGLRSVSTGDCDAMIINQMYASYIIDKEGITNLKITGESGYLNRLSAATSIKDHKLFHIIDRIIDEIPPARKKELYRKWINGKTSQTPKEVITFLGIVIGISTALASIFWIWSLSLKRQVQMKTEEIKEKEKKSRLDAENLRVTLDSIGDAVIATDESGNITLMNQVAEELTGWKIHDAVSKKLDEVFLIINEKTREKQSNKIDLVIKTGEKSELTEDTLLVSKTGIEYQIADSVAPIFDMEGDIIGTVLVFRDVTDEKRLAKELMKMEKLEALGMLAGGIAHDFNNMLTALFGNIEMAKISIHSNHEAKKFLESAGRAMDTATNLTRQLLTFAKGGDPVKEIFSIGELISETAHFSLCGSSTSLNTNLAPDLWMVEADKGQISQVISNLVINAEQAMPKGGSILITARNTEISEKKYVKCIVKDSGPGISHEIIDKIFDPYFTTKDGGNGLGLTTAYSIIKKHGGEIRVSSTPGLGTEFTILLPACEKKACTAIKKPSTSENSHAGPSKILVLDDEDIVNDVLSAMLSEMGYKVTSVSDGKDAVKKYKDALEEKNPFDLVITDLTIPDGMNGLETAEKILEINPHAKIIISSGYANSPVMANYKEHGFKAVVTKPYRFSYLKNVVDMLLDK